MGLDNPERSPQIDQAIEEGLVIKSQSPYKFHLFCLKMKEMADGVDAQGLRTHAYADWTDKDFLTVLEETGGTAMLEKTSKQEGPLYYEEILQSFQSRKKDTEYYDSIFKMVQLASGGNPHNLRRTFPGWSNDDFKRLLLDLDQEEALRYDF